MLPCCPCTDATLNLHDCEWAGLGSTSQALAGAHAALYPTLGLPVDHNDHEIRDWAGGGSTSQALTGTQAALPPEARKPPESYMILRCSSLASLWHVSADFGRALLLASGKLPAATHDLQSACTCAGAASCTE